MSILANYNLECPTKASALLVFTNAFDRNRAELYWKEACKATGVANDDESIEALEKVFAYLSRLEGSAGIYGLSLKARLLTYKNIQRVQNRQKA